MERNGMMVSKGFLEEPMPELSCKEGGERKCGSEGHSRHRDSTGH